METQSTNNKLPIILAAGISAIVFGLGGYLIASMATKDTDTTTTTSTGTSTATTSTATPTVKSTTTTSTLDTKDWKTYTNTKYNYSIKYPSTGWSIHSDLDPNPLDTSPFLGFSITNSREMSHWLEFRSHSVQAAKDQINLIHNASTTKNYQTKTITFADQSATQMTFTTTSDGKDIADIKVIIFAHGNDTVVLFGITKDYEKTNGIDVGIFDKMIETFKFTN